ncbi:hypothetical protein SDC9_140214 [bioreactor metagenome]|uniref:Uncharacterized protein n=1 Tax=bioreactor metagenome TaxID=1076179 RepID=A0A645DVD3_9ZZZZ
MKPSRRRKQRKAYLSLSVSFSFAVTRFCALAISQSAATKCVYALTASGPVPSSNQGNRTLSSVISSSSVSAPSAFLIRLPLLSTSFLRLSSAASVNEERGISITSPNSSRPSILRSSKASTSSSCFCMASVMGASGLTYCPGWCWSISGNSSNAPMPPSPLS